MKKRVAGILCLTLLLTSLMPLMADAVSDVIFIAVNDEFPELSVETAPIRVNGITYIPCTIFDKRVTGVNIGVFYAWNATESRITIYSREKNLAFDVNAGTAYAYPDETEYIYQAVIRNGIPYIPAAATCRYFGLACSFLNTDDGQYQLLRIKNGNQILDDKLFMRSVSFTLEERAEEYKQKIEQGSTTLNNGGTTTPAQGEEEDAGKKVDVYLSFRVGEGEHIPSILSALKKNRQVKAIFFFSNDMLISHDDMIRELVGNGHRIGLIAQGSTLEEKRASLQRANELLKHILRQKATFVLHDGLSAETEAGLKEDGYLPWKATITITSQGKSDSALYRTILTEIEKSNSKAKVLLDDQVKGGTISSVLRQLKQEQYDLHAIRETDY